MIEEFTEQEIISIITDYYNNYVLNLINKLDIYLEKLNIELHKINQNIDEENNVDIKNHLFNRKLNLTKFHNEIDRNLKSIKEGCIYNDNILMNSNINTGLLTIYLTNLK